MVHCNPSSSAPFPRNAEQVIRVEPETVDSLRHGHLCLLGAQAVCINIYFENKTTDKKTRTEKKERAKHRDTLKKNDAQTKHNSNIKHRHWR